MGVSTETRPMSVSSCRILEPHDQMRSGKAHAVALDKVVEINGGLARHDVKSCAGLGPVGMVGVEGS